MNGESLNGMKRGLLLKDFSHVQFIHIQSESFKNVFSLTISNLSELKFLIFENYSFSNTTSLTLSSIFWVVVIEWIDLPNLTTFTTGYKSFLKTTSVTLSSIF